MSARIARKHLSSAGPADRFFQKKYSKPSAKSQRSRVPQGRPNSPFSILNYQFSIINYPFSPISQTPLTSPLAISYQKYPDCPAASR